MKILLIYPEYENTLWNVKKAGGQESCLPSTGTFNCCGHAPSEVGEKANWHELPDPKGRIYKMGRLCNDRFNSGPETIYQKGSGTGP